MSKIRFTLDAEDQALMRRVVARANRELDRRSLLPDDGLSIAMDLTACHLNGCRLDLAGLIDADAFDFVHDVLGIHQHLDRGTGRLTGQFEPRYAARSREPAARGFTLLEMLACVAVVGVLMGLLVPALATAREAGRRTACLVNLRSLGQSLAMYRHDNRDRLPVARGIADAAAGRLDPFDTLGRYLDAPLPRVSSDFPDEVETGDPWRCGSDHRAAATGFSYWYAPGVVFELTRPGHELDVHRLFSRDPGLPLFLDFDLPHGGRRNVLTGDGAVSTEG